MDFQDSSSALRRDWLWLASEEKKHENWLLHRLQALGFAQDERPVSEKLSESLFAARSAESFCHQMATAEKRGQLAGEKMSEALSKFDPTTGELLATIAREEKMHVELALRHFPKLKSSLSA